MENGLKEISSFSDSSKRYLEEDVESIVT